METSKKQDNDETMVLRTDAAGHPYPGRPLTAESKELIIPGCELLSELGSGGMGQVFLGRQNNLNRLVAIKALKMNTPESKELRMELKDEARTMAAFNHPNIVACYDVIEKEENLYLVMEYVPGETTMRDLVQRYGKLPESIVLPILLEIVDGLSYMQAHGYIHRDLKPDNLLVSCDKSKLPWKAKDLALGVDFRIKICDFGIASSRDIEKRKSTKGAMGSPNYMAPEQIYAPDSADFRSDEYALGSTVLFLLSGYPPFRIADRDELFEHKVENDTPSAISLGLEVSHRFSDILERMTRADADERYPDYKSLKTELEFLAGCNQRRKISRWRTLSILLIFIFLIAGANYGKHCIEERFFRERLVSLASSVGLWDGEREAWRVILMEDDPHEMVMTGTSMTRPLELKQSVFPGRNLELMLRHPGLGALILKLTASSGRDVRLLWNRDGQGLNTFTLFYGNRQYPIDSMESRFGNDWLNCRFELRRKGILVYLDNEPVGIVPFRILSPCRFSIQLTTASWVMMKKVYIY